MHYHSNYWCQFELRKYFFLHFIFLGCIKLIKSNSIDIYEVTQISISPELSVFANKLHILFI